MKKTIFLFFAAVGLSSNLTAQNEHDALRYSQFGITGTARSLGFGGALGSIGADFGSLSVNPAGLGFYRSSEVLITPLFGNIHSQSDYRGNSTEGNRYNLSLANGGMVYTTDELSGNWEALNFGIGWNRVADFNRNINFNAVNDESTMLDKFQNDLDGYSTGQIDYSMFSFPTVLSYDTYLLNPNADSTSYSHVIGNNAVEQTGSITQRGAIDEYVLSIGANYNNRLSIGATLGLPYLHYRENFSYEEKNTADSTSDFQSYQLNSTSRTEGTGVNFKFGLIYRAGWLRIGGAVHSPTYYDMNDHYSSNMTANFDTITHTVESPKGAYNYNLTTPWRLIGSASLVVMKMGFITVDYEWLDYSQAFYSFNNDALGDDNDLYANEINQKISALYGTAQNIRMGAEVALGSFRVRAGYAMSSSPLLQHEGSFNEAGSMKAISFGGGIREEDIFVDLAYVRTMTKDSRELYTAEGAENTAVLNTDITNGSLVLTMGVKF